MSSSGLIFAVIVGAWAAYLVPMWLRRQDELNEARPTERFSTALRLLTRGRRGTPATTDEAPADESASADADPKASNASAADVRAYAEPITTVPQAGAAPKPAPPDPRAAARAKVLARRRRTTMVLFLAFTLGGIFALSSGPGLLWLPVVPAVLLLAYVIHVRRQERRRYVVALDRRRAEEAARLLRQRTQASAAARPEPPKRTPEPKPERERERPARAMVEQTDHAEWVDQQRGRGGAAPEDEPETWDPAPVPLPTYVNAPVAPRTTRGVDLDAPDTWSAARSTTAGTPQPPAQPSPPRQDPAAPRRTPLFDQYAEDDPPRRRRASGE